MALVKLIATDMDCTLLLNDGTLPVGIFPRISALHEAGIEFALASGRTTTNLEDYFRPVRDKVIFLAENGGVLKRSGKVLSVTYMRHKQLDPIVEFVRKQENVIAIGNALDASYIENADQSFESAVSSFISRAKIVPNLTAPELALVKLTLFFPNEDASFALDNIYGPKFGSDLAVTFGGPACIDIMPKQVNKGYGIRRLGLILGIGLDDIMALGDSTNDIEMMKAVGYPVLVDNAIPCLWEYGKYHTGTNEEQGVFQAIDRVLAGKTPETIA